MNILRRICSVLLVLLFTGIVYLWLRPPEPLRALAAYGAKTVCSNVFLAGRDPDEVLRDDVKAPGLGVLKLLRVSVDRSRGVVRAGLFGFVGDGLAVARPGLGCTLVPDGALAGLVPAPSGATAPPLSASPAPWPEGEALMPDAAYQRVINDDALTGPGMRAVVVVDHGRLVAERYGGGFSAATPLQGWSMAKSVTAALVGLLVKDEKLALDQAAFWPAGDEREAIKLSDLMSMSSGLRWNEDYADYAHLSDVLRMLYIAPDMAGYAYAQPLAKPPGTEWRYSSGTANIVARIVQAAAGSASFAHDRLFAPLGMQSAVMEPDARGTPVGSSYMYASAHDWARFGLFLVQGGVWHGQALLPEGYVDAMAAPLELSAGQYGHGFVWLWASDARTPGVNPDAAFGIPPDTFYLEGHDGQSVAVIRSRQLVVVRLGLTPVTENYSTQALLQALLQVRAGT